MMQRIRIFLLLIFSISAQAQDMDVYQKKLYLNQEDTLPYRIMYPPGFDETGKYPLLLFLHGAGERGNDNEKQLVHGGSLFADPANRRDFPAVVVFPQCPQDDWWARMERSEDQDGGTGFSLSPAKALPIRPCALYWICLMNWSTQLTLTLTGFTSVDFPWGHGHLRPADPAAQNICRRFSHLWRGQSQNGQENFQDYIVLDLSRGRR